MGNKEQLTISVSDTGPKLVTKMLVLISVTFSVGTDRTHAALNCG